jgi:hypothetical protein
MILACTEGIGWTVLIISTFSKGHDPFSGTGYNLALILAVIFQTTADGMLLILIPEGQTIMITAPTVLIGGILIEIIDKAFVDLPVTIVIQIITDLDHN